MLRLGVKRKHVNDALMSAYQIDDSQSLRDRLIDFDAHVIRERFPDTPISERLLRPAMLEALLEYQPETKEDFFGVCFCLSTNRYVEG